PKEPARTGRAAGGVALRARILMSAAALILVRNSALSPSIEVVMSLVGLATKSTAPISSALIVTSALAWVNDEIMTTGSGLSSMTLRRKDKPSMRGISTSSVMTSGLSSLI